MTGWRNWAPSARRRRASPLDDSSLRPGPQSGFALIVVIWAIGVLTLLFVTYIGAARYRSIEAMSLSERARAEAMANAGIQIAIFDLLSGIRSGKVSSARFRLDGRPVLCTLGDRSALAIAVEDEGGKVDLNAAAPSLIEALIRGIRRDDRAAARVAGSLLEVRMAVTAANAAQGGTPPGEGVAAAFKSVLELDQLPGMDRDLFRALVPLVTVHTRSAGVDPRVAPAGVLAAISPKAATASRADAERIFPATFVAESPGTIFLVSAEAMTGPGARFAREAVVEVSADLPAGYRMREWRDGSLRLLDRSMADAGLPAC